MRVKVQVFTQTHMDNDNQLIQRIVIAREFDLPDDETLDTAFLHLAVQHPDGHFISVIQK